MRNIKYLLYFLSCVSIYAAPVLPQDRVIDWANWTGVPGGIPWRTQIFCNIKTSIPGSTLVATGNGSTDDTAAVRAAINLCPSNQVVYFPAGTYRVTGNLTFKSGISFRGESPATAKIGFTGSSARDPITVGSYGDGPTFSISSPGVAKGASNATVTSTSGLAVRDFVVLDQLNYSSGDFLISGVGAGGGDNDWALEPRTGRNSGQLVTVTSISGNTVTFWPPAMWHFTNSPQLFKLSSYIERVGFENLGFTNLTPGSGYTVWYFRQARYCWITNCYSLRPPTRNLQMFRTANCTIIHNDFVKPSPVGVNNGYMTEIWDTSSFHRFEDNLFVEGYSGLEPHTKGGGHVFAYNFFTNFLQGTDNAPYDVVGAHGGHLLYNLYEGNNCFQMYFDGFFGSSSHNVAYRNKIRGYDIGTATEPHVAPWRCFDLMGFHRQFSSIGNVLGAAGRVNIYEANNINSSYGTPYIYKLGYATPGDDSPSGNDPAVKTTLIQHANWDSATTTNGGLVFARHIISETNLPPSYYLSTKPGWFAGAAWPPYDPYTPQGRTNWIPAQYRFNRVALPGGGPVITRPEPPTNFHVSN